MLCSQQCKLEFFPSDSSKDLFSFWDSGLVVPFFRSLIAKLSEQGIVDYRLKILPMESVSFKVVISHSKGHKNGPRHFSHCLSCDGDNATIAENNFEGGEGVRGPPGGLPPHLRSLTTAMCEWELDHESEGQRGEREEDGLARVWMDAQARPLFIVTPRRHTHGLHDMTDNELSAVWRAVGRVINMSSANPRQPKRTDRVLDQTNCEEQDRDEGEEGNDDVHPKIFRQEGHRPVCKEIVLNVGTFRNIEHAHIKVWFHDKDFLDRMTRWPQPRRALHGALHDLRRLMKIPPEQLLRDQIRDQMAMQARKGKDERKIEGMKKGDQASQGVCGDGLDDRSPGEGEGDVDRGVSLVVRGHFGLEGGDGGCGGGGGDDDALELWERFSAFVRVLRVDLKDVRCAPNALVVVSGRDVDAVIRALRELNLTRMGRNVMCKVKVLQEEEASER